MDSHEKPVYVAHVGTGFTQKLLDSLMIEFKKIKTTDAVAFIVQGIEGVTWVEPILFSEVSYQVVTMDCKLRMPRLYTLKIDKDSSECTVDQIEGK